MSSKAVSCAKDQLNPAGNSYHPYWAEGWLMHKSCNPVYTFLGVIPIDYNRAYFRVNMHRIEVRESAEPW